MISIALGILSVPILAFGSLVALGGQTALAEAGLFIIITGGVCVVTLATSLLFHAYYEIRQQGFPSHHDFNDSSVIHAGSRIIETLLAGIFLTGLLAMIGSSLALGSVPEIFSLVVALSGVLLPIIVFIHAAGAFAGAALDVM